MGGEEKRDEGGSIKIVWTLELGNLDYFIIFPQITPSKKKLEHFDRLDPPPYLALHFALFALREPLRDCLCRSVRVAAFICELVVDHEERGRRRRRKPPPSPAPLSASRLFTDRGGGERRAKIPEENTREVPLRLMKQQIPCGNITRAFSPRGIGTKEGEGVRSYAFTDARTDGRTPAGV